MALVVCRIPRICDERACLSTGGGCVDAFVGGFGLELTWCRVVLCVVVVRSASSMTTCIVWGHPVAGFQLFRPYYRARMHVVNIGGHRASFERGAIPPALRFQLWK